MSIVFLSYVRRRCSALSKYCSNVSYVGRLLTRFLLLLTNYCLIEDTGIGAFILCLSNKATWWSFTAFSRVCPCILYISLKISNFRCENLHVCTVHQ